MANFNKMFTDLVENASKLVQDGSHRALSVLDKEREKAKMRSEIGYNKKELSKSYEELGRACYDALMNGTELSAKEIIEHISSKEKSLELLSEKLKSVEKEEQI